MLLSIGTVMGESVDEKTVALHSIGCRTNQQEMTVLKQELLSAGYSIVEKMGDARLIIVNTCSVTSCTESKTGRLLSSISRDCPQAQILVTGCFAQQKKQQIASIKGVRWVVGNREKNNIVAIIEQNQGGVFCPDICSEDALLHSRTAIHGVDQKRTRYSLKIQEGCSFGCAYCIVPSLRGPSRSLKRNELIDAVKTAVATGYKEIVLAGTHIGQYKDPETGGGFLELIKELVNTDGDFRIRLSSVDPRDLSDELMEIVGSEKKVCDHLHLSIQSFSAEVLKKMDRPWSDLQSFVQRLRGFRKANPSAGLGGDFIVGHPGETEECFLETLNQIESIGFSYGHVFRFSKRPGTKACDLKEQVPGFQKSARSAALRKTLTTCRRAFLSGLVGETFKIIVEAEKPVRGVTSNYIKVHVPECTATRNTWLQVRINEPDADGYCIAEKSRMEGKI